MTESQYQWSRKSLSELVDFYYTEIRPAMQKDDYDPKQGRPSYEWLAANGFSGLSYTLREHHDLTVKEFFIDCLGRWFGVAALGLAACSLVRRPVCHRSTYR